MAVDDIMESNHSFFCNMMRMKEKQQEAIIKFEIPPFVSSSTEFVASLRTYLAAMIPANLAVAKMGPLGPTSSDDDEPSS